MIKKNCIFCVYLHFINAYAIIPSLTVEKQENGYKPSKYGKYSRFSFCIDMCYFFWLFNIFVFLIIVRMELLVIIS